MTETIKIYCLRADDLIELDWDGHTVTAWDCPYCGAITTTERPWHIVDPSEPLIERLENSRPPLNAFRLKVNLPPLPPRSPASVVKTSGEKLVGIGPADDYPALRETMDLPNIGDEAICQHCGDEIVYVGAHWEHLDNDPHLIIPVKRKASL